MVDHFREVQQYEQAVDLYPQNKRERHLLQETQSLVQKQHWLNKRQAPADKPALSREADTQAKLTRIRCLRLRRTKGLKACNAALLQFPQDAELYFAKGNTPLELKRLPEAGKAYRLAAQLDPDNVKYSRKLAAFNKNQSTDKSHAQPVMQPPPGGSSSAPSAVATAQDTVLTRMTLLKTLRDKDLIAEKEYQQRKKALLDETLATTGPRGVEAKPSAVPTDIAFGNYYALVIGIQNYQHLPKLQTYIRDAIVVAQVLEQNYGFVFEKLPDATRRDILLSLSKFRRTLSADDNLLVYYAGNGWLDKEADPGY